MKALIDAAVVVGVLGCTSTFWAADDAASVPANPLGRYSRSVGGLVKQYYPDATVSVSHDEKLNADRIHFEYNTELFVMRYRNKDGSWQEPQKVIGPYVGGIWCDVVLQRGRYQGDVENAEEGVTEMGPDFYSYLVAPYSKKQDRHLTVKLRYPGGTPPEFLKDFAVLAKDFERYVDVPEPEK
jgi:hypothetical protein